MKRQLILILTALASISGLRAQTWNGSESSLWTTAGNWTPSGAPGADATLAFDEVANQTVDLEGGTRTVTVATFDSPDDYTVENGEMEFSVSSATLGTSGVQQIGAGRIVFNSDVSFTGPDSGGAYAEIQGGDGSGEVEFAGNLTKSNSTRLRLFGTTVRFTGSSAKNLGSNDLYIGLNGSNDPGTLIVAMSTQTAQNGSVGTGRLYLGNGTLEFQGLGATLANTLWVGSGHGVLKSAQTLTLNGDVSTVGSRTLVFDSGTATTIINGNVQNSGATVRTFTFEAKSDVQVSGTVQNGAGYGALSFLKTGTATVAFEAANTYAGTTTITAGTLLINGNQSAAAGAVDVQANGTLGGSGTVGGATTVNGLVAPGNSIGNLTIANTLTLAPDGAYEWEISDWNGATAGVDWDLITLSGANNLDILSTSGNPFTINITEYNLSGFVEENRSFVIVSAGGSILNFDPAKFALNTDAFTAGAGSWAIGTAGSDLVLSYSAVPEPHTAGLILLGLAVVLCGLRRRAVSAS